MTSMKLFADGNQIRVGPRVGKGGEGEVYLLEGQPKTALKIYTLNSVEKVRAREHKIRAMVEAKLGETAPIISFPRALVSDSNGRFKGFLMSAVRDHKVFHELYGPASRKHSFPKADYKFLVRVASNIARAVAAVHRSGCVIGDINHSGILVSESATVSLIDADSFQFEWKSTVFPCEVGVPEYTPPELQGRSFSGITRTINHDRFGLAVVIFQLLMMGRHPFSGTPRRGEMLPLHEAILQSKYVYSETVDVGFDQPPGTPAISDLSSSLSVMFDRAFTQAGRDRRPSAEEWITSLEKFEAELQRCKSNPMHYRTAAVDDCPWCEMESLANVILFLPPLMAGALAGGTGDTATDLRTLISQLRGINLPPRDRILPAMQPYSPVSVSLPAAGALSSSMPAIKKVAVVVIAISLFVLVPALWFVWAGLGFWLFSAIDDVDDGSARAMKSAAGASNDWAKMLIAWQRKIGVDSFLSKKHDADGLANEFDQLASAKQIELNSANSNRRTLQLATFLDGFEIRRAKIKGIGPARLAQLISYGVETAADIDRSRLLAVPGFGDGISRPLLEWRSSLEARFVYNPASSVSDQLEISKINEKYRLKASHIEKSLRTAVLELVRLRQQITTEMSRPEPTLEFAFHRLEDQRAELRQRNIPIPPVTFDWPTVTNGVRNSAGSNGAASRSGSGAQQAGYSTTKIGTNPKCPRCGSTMHRRTARRGSNAGGSFWGCSRFPVCRGTRN